jgi:hypothetical protein
MNDDQFVLTHSVIEEIGLAGGRKHTNTGNIALSPESRMSGEQLAR